MHFDTNLIFLLLVGLAALFRWLVQAGGSKENGPPDNQPRRQAPRPESQTDEERIRKFLEALGQPAGSKPPPKVTPRRAAAPPPPPPPATSSPARRSVLVPNLPPLTTAPSDLPPRVQPTPRPPAVQPQIIVPKNVVPLQQRTIVVAPVPALSAGLISRLGDPNAVRDAIVLREILGPPRGLQQLDRFSV